jgi:hypothetical protein
LASAEAICRSRPSPARSSRKSVHIKPGDQIATLEDLVRLLGLVDDVEAVCGELKPSERKRLGSISARGDEDHPTWSILFDPDDARAAFGRLAD